MRRTSSPGGIGVGSAVGLGVAVIFD